VEKLTIEIVSKVRKRDGRVVDFEQRKITDAIYKAFVAVGLPERTGVQEISDEVTNTLNERFQGRIPSVEDIQDIVVETLKRKGFGEVSEEYAA
jgi:transcriptional regulator NrdR family protein